MVSGHVRHVSLIENNPGCLTNHLPTVLGALLAHESVRLICWARKRAIWILLSDSGLPDVPRLSWKELQFLTLGIYQLKQSRSCTHEHLNQSGLYSIYVNREDSSVVRIQLRSRHTSSKIYKIWKRTGIGHNPNIELYCQCKVGARVVGCCARVASVLRYLGYWHHNHTQTKTPSLGYAGTLQDAATGWSSDDSASESEK
ncbi:uncharacterized protein TNCT_285301 [Trichonephila clavata]|uniref:SWIM-type domain-containing protein n=1 Tax=Trichonephila clavata TaxID=2740835 RepID=A0A8X6LNV2_TRICU|nr:uncharacterized protein TNCT_285301 [Trichonephila clavata]